MSYEVIFYSTPRGEKPVKEFIFSQDESTKSKYLHLATLLSQYGPFLRLPFSRKLDKNLYELRGKGKSKLRIIYTYCNQKYILLHAFIKKTPKTPPKEISVAKSRQLTLI